MRGKRLFASHKKIYEKYGSHKRKKVLQVVINVSKKFVMLATFCERVEGIDMNLPKEIAAMAGNCCRAKLKELGYGG